jgi:diacylglycerol kinase
MSFSARARLKSFRFAVQGLATLLRTQHNTWVHLLATLLVLLAAWYFELRLSEWTAVILAIGLVWVAEAANTAIEFLADAVRPEPHPLIGKAKDLGAAAVLLACLCAVAVGAVVIVSHLSASP